MDSLNIFPLNLVQSRSILTDPKNSPLLSEVYKGQQQRLRVIVDDLLEIEELSDVSLTVFMPPFLSFI